jgi:hypothetical protein
VVSGFPPVANDDKIVVVREATTTTLSSGFINVVDNDFDPKNDSLTVFLTCVARSDELLLRFDGTFVYECDGGRRDNDHFRYVLYDETGFLKRLESISKLSTEIRSFRRLLAEMKAQ